MLPLDKPSISDFKSGTSNNGSPEATAEKSSSMSKSVVDLTTKKPKLKTKADAIKHQVTTPSTTPSTTDSTTEVACHVMPSQCFPLPEMTEPRRSKICNPIRE